MKHKAASLSFLIIFLLSVFFSLSIFAADNEAFVLTNKDAVIDLSYPIIFKNDTYYISLDDLNSINLDSSVYEKESCFIYKLYGKEEDFEYYLPECLCKDDVYYFPLSELADRYSDIYEVDTENNIIRIWINDYTTETFKVTVSVPEGISLPESGITVNFYSGTKRRVSYTGGGYNYDHIGYPGTDTVIPDETDITSHKNIAIDKRKAVTFTEATKTTVLKFDIVVRGAHYSSGGGTSSTDSDVIGYYVNDNNFIGGKYVIVDENETDIRLTLNNIYPTEHIFGSVTIPSQDTDVSFTIYAEADAEKSYKDNGSYSVTRKYVFKTVGVISAEETSVNYDLTVIPYHNYDIHIVFDDGCFKRQSASFTNLESDVNYDFNNFTKSNLITGSIALPSDMSEFLDYYNETLSEINGKIVLQQANAPYYLIDTFFCINTEEKNASFILADDIGLENAIIYYSLFDEVKGINGIAHYKNSTESVAHVKNAKNLTSSDNNLNISIQKASTIAAELIFPTDEPELDLNIIIYEADTRDDYIEIDAARTNYESSDENTTIFYVFSIPDEYTYFSVKFTDEYYGLNYFTKNGVCEKSSNNIDIFSTLQSSCLSFTYNGIDDTLPIILKDVELHDDCAYISYANPGKTDCAGMTCYLAFYDKTGKLLDVFSDICALSSKSIAEKKIEFLRSVPQETEYIKCLLWNGDISPMSEKLQFTY